jgi:hypothetical protein
MSKRITRMQSTLLRRKPKEMGSKLQRYGVYLDLVNKSLDCLLKVVAIVSSVTALVILAL